MSFRTHFFRIIPAFTMFWLLSCKPRDFNTTAETSASGKTWILSGYLPENPDNKVWVTISGSKISSIDKEKPRANDNTLVVETEGYLSPGLMDLHNHVKYNVLPLWGDAKSLFLNRFEWRTSYPPYKKAVSFNMKALDDSDSICAAVRWAELIALSGGVTAIQGIGNDKICATAFGVRNVELPNEFGSKTKVRSATDVIMPALIGKVYKKEIYPLVKKHGSYEKGFEAFLKQHGIQDWIDDFVKNPVSEENAYRLMFGKEFVSQNPRLAEYFPKGRGESSEAKRFWVETFGRAPFKFAEPKAVKQMDALRKWFEEYMALRNHDEKKALDFLGKGGTMAFAPTYGSLTDVNARRRYIVMFHEAIRQSVGSSLRKADSLAVIMHLAEGRRDDKYNQEEYALLKEFGLAEKGVVIIHGVGMSHSDFSHARQKGISLVWSPFSNLLLYGETLDIETAKKAGLNIALGADWTPTGGKNLLDELKLARAYLDSERIKISNQDLVEMATKNAAKAIERDSVVGEIRRGYQADIAVFAKTGNNPWDSIVQAEQKDVQLVVVGGQPLYGDTAYIQEASKYFGDNAAPEEIVPDERECGFKKSVRVPDDSKIKASHLRFPSALKKHLSNKFEAYARKVPGSDKKYLVNLNPMFVCEDKEYRARVDGEKRFEKYVQVELRNNRNSVQSLRNKFNLKPKFDPLGLDGEEGNEDGGESNEFAGENSNDE